MNKKSAPPGPEDLAGFLDRAEADESSPVRLLEDEEGGDPLLIYATESGAEVQFRYKGEALWMTQDQIVALFGRDQSVISRHIKNIFAEGELDEASNMQKMHNARSTRPVTLYSLDTIISVGYRVSSRQATLFRKWATAKLVQFASKGFVIDVRRLKHPENLDRIDELREIIRDIRASEANVYREIRRICSLCQDYVPNSKQAQDFYATMQNKMLWAVASMTGPELVKARADAALPNMGLTSWPHDHIRKADVTVANNYLTDREIREKNRLTTMLLDFFEDRFEQGRLVLMDDAKTELDRFLKFNDRPVLMNKGAVKRADADRAAHAQYVIFDAGRRRLRHAED